MTDSQVHVKLPHMIKLRPPKTHAKPGEQPIPSSSIAGSDFAKLEMVNNDTPKKGRKRGRPRKAVAPATPSTSRMAPTTTATVTTPLILARLNLREAARQQWEDLQLSNLTPLASRSFIDLHSTMFPAVSPDVISTELEHIIGADDVNQLKHLLDDLSNADLLPSGLHCSTAEALQRSLESLRRCNTTSSHDCDNTTLGVSTMGSLSTDSVVLLDSPPPVRPVKPRPTADGTTHKWRSPPTRRGDRDPRSLAGGATVSSLSACSTDTIDSFTHLTLGVTSPAGCDGQPSATEAGRGLKRRLQECEQDLAAMHFAAVDLQIGGAAAQTPSRKAQRQTKTDPPCQVHQESPATAADRQHGVWSESGRPRRAAAVAVQSFRALLTSEGESDGGSVEGSSKEEEGWEAAGASDAGEGAAAVVGSRTRRSSGRVKPQRHQRGRRGGAAVGRRIVGDERGIRGESSSAVTGQRKMASKEARSVFYDWIASHRDNPYPSTGEKEALAEATGMSVQQVIHWFSNVRKRRLVPLINQGKQSQAGVDIRFLSELEKRAKPAAASTVGISRRHP